MNSGLEELKNPSRSLPIVVVSSLVTITVIYLLVNVAFLAVIGVPDMLASSVVADVSADSPSHNAPDVRRASLRPHHPAHHPDRHHDHHGELGERRILHGVALPQRRRPPGTRAVVGEACNVEMRGTSSM